MRNVNRKGVQTDTLQLLYDSDIDLIELIRREFSSTYEYVNQQRALTKSRGIKRPHVKIPLDTEELLEVYGTGLPFEFEIRFITLKQEKKTTKEKTIKKDEDIRLTVTHTDNSEIYIPRLHTEVYKREGDILDKFRTPYSSLKGSMYDSLKSSRSMNIPINAAIGELLDNSFEWTATNIWITYQEKTDVNYEIPKRIVVIDDGLGMNPEKLADHLTVGFHDPFGCTSRDTISKYGVGAKYAFFNVCTKSEVWSKQEDGAWYKAEFNLEDPYLKKEFRDWIKEFEEGKSEGYPRPAIQQNPPNEFKDIWGDFKSGTVVIWSNFDRVDLCEGIDEITWWISRTFRNYIGNKIVMTEKDENGEIITSVVDNRKERNIFFNGEKIQAWDPLYRIPFRDGDLPCEDSLLDYRPLPIPYPVDDHEWREIIGSPSANIIVHFGIAPPEWRSEIKTSAESPINIKDRRIQGAAPRHGGYRFWDTRSVSIIRSGREVGWIQDGWLTGRVEDIDRWWGMAIEFGPELDDAFQVKNVKYEVKPTGDLRTKIREEIKSTIMSLRKEISDHFEESERKKKTEKQKEEVATGKVAATVESTPTQEAVDEDPGLVGHVGDTEETPEQMMDRLFADLPPHIRRQILDEAARRKLTIKPNLDKRVPEDTNLMFEFSAKGGNVFMVRYDNHPYYRHLFKRYEELKNIGIEMEEKVAIENGEIDNEEVFNLLLEMKQIITEIESLRDFGMNSAVIALARLQPTGENRRMLLRFLSEWSRLNMSLVKEAFNE